MFMRYLVLVRSSRVGDHLVLVIISCWWDHLVLVRSSRVGDNLVLVRSSRVGEIISCWWDHLVLVRSSRVGEIISCWWDHLVLVRSYHASWDHPMFEQSIEFNFYQCRYTNFLKLISFFSVSSYKSDLEKRRQRYPKKRQLNWIHFDLSY